MNSKRQYSLRIISNYTAHRGYLSFSGGLHQSQLSLIMDDGKTCELVIPDLLSFDESFTLSTSKLNLPADVF